MLWASLTSVALNVIGNALLIPSYGALGAATATASSLAFGEFLKYIKARKYLDIDASVLAWFNIGRLRVSHK